MPTKYLLAFCLMLTGLLAHADFSAYVIGITDGDAIKVLDSSYTEHKTPPRRGS